MSVPSQAGLVLPAECCSIRELLWHSGFVAMVANTAQLCCFKAECPHVGEGFATASVMMFLICK